MRTSLRVRGCFCSGAQQASCPRRLARVWAWKGQRGTHHAVKCTCHALSSQGGRIGRSRFVYRPRVRPCRTWPVRAARAGWGQNVCARTTAAHGHIGRYKTGGIAYQVPSVGWYRAVHPNRSTPTITRRKRRRDREWVRTRSLSVVGLACTKNKIHK